MTAITRPLSATSGAGQTTLVSSFTVTDPGAIDTDDVVVVVIATRRDRTVTTPSGWNVLGPFQAGNNDATGSNLYVFWRRGEPTTWSFSLSSSSTGWAWVCDVFRGVKTTGDPWHSTATGNGTDATAEVSALSSLPTECMAIACIGYSDTSGAGGTPTTFGSDPSGWAATAVLTNNKQYGALMAYDDLGSATSVSQATWTLDQAPNNWTSRMLALAAAERDWTGTAATTSVAASSATFTPGVTTWTVTGATVTMSASSGSFTAGSAAWVGTGAAVSMSSASGAFAAGDATWTASSGQVLVAASSGSFVAADGPQTWTGTATSLIASASSSSFTAGAITWASSGATVAVSASSGLFAAGDATWPGHVASVDVTAASGLFSDGGAPQSWLGAGATVTVTAANGGFLAVRAAWVALHVSSDTVEIVAAATWSADLLAGRTHLVTLTASKESA